MKKLKNNEQVNLYQYEEALEDSGVKYIAGVDEVGRGWHGMKNFLKVLDTLKR